MFKMNFQSWLPNEKIMQITIHTLYEAMKQNVDVYFKEFKMISTLSSLKLVKISILYKSPIFNLSAMCRPSRHHTLYIYCAVGSRGKSCLTYLGI